MGNEYQEEVKSVKPTKIKISLKSQSVTSLSENTDDATNEYDEVQGEEVDIKTEASEPNDTCDTIQIENTYSEQVKDELQDYDHHEESDFEVYDDLIREDDIKKENSDQLENSVSKIKISLKDKTVTSEDFPKDKGNSKKKKKKEREVEELNNDVDQSNIKIKSEKPDDYF